jgi:imidazolonepropionase-like amidohydrolase
MTKRPTSRGAKRCLALMLCSAMLIGSAPAQARPTATFPMAPAPAVTRALVGGTIVDVESGKTIPDSVILIRGDRIVAVGSAAGVPIPADAQRLSMAGKWLMPGLINCHVHLGLVLPGAAGAALADETDPELALRMADNARRSLLSGVTTVRLTGEEHGVDFALKRAINAGEVAGPRIETAGEIIVPTGGHGMLEVNGPDGFAKAIREQVKLGASWIKIAISGGIADSHGNIAAAPVTDAEMAAVSDVAGRLGVQIAAHNGSPIAAAQAMKYGVNSFEHGYFFTEQTLTDMKAKGVWLVPTIVVSQSGAQQFFAKIGSPPWYLDRVKSVGKAHWAMLQNAIRIGVPIALGTDEMPYEPNEGTTATIREAELYVEAGMTPLQALRAATVSAARMLRLSADVGSLQPGHYADVIALDANPLSDIHALRGIGFVMKGGRIAVSGGDLPRPEL